jgi:hypothetical protein
LPTASWNIHAKATAQSTHLVIPAQYVDSARVPDLQEENLQQHHHRLRAAVKDVTKEGDHSRGIRLKQLYRLGSTAHSITTSGGTMKVSDGDTHACRVWDSTGAG